MPQESGLVCVSGPSKGKQLPKLTPLGLMTTWGDWHAKHPSTTILMGGDRGKPIPTE